MASLALTALRRTLLPLLIFAGFVIWQSNEGAKTHDRQALERMCMALEEHYAEVGACPDSLDGLFASRTPMEDAQSQAHFAYAKEAKSCTLAVAKGPGAGQSCRVPK